MVLDLKVVSGGSVQPFVLQNMVMSADLDHFSKCTKEFVTYQQIRCTQSGVRVYDGVRKNVKWR